MGVDDVSCQIVIGFLKCCMKPVWSLFLLVLVPTPLAAQGFATRLLTYIHTAVSQSLSLALRYLN